MTSLVDRPVCKSCSQPTTFGLDRRGWCIVCRMTKAPHWPCPRCKEEYPTTAYRKKGDICSVCKSDDREAFLRAAKAERELTEIVGGPKAYQEHKENSFQVVPENKNAFDMVMKFQPSIHNLYLYGPCGAGKTMLARMAAIAIYGEGYKVEILRPRELVRKVWRNDFRYEEQELEHYSKLDVLIVDELGAGKNNEGLTAVLLEILSRRIDSGKAGMIITSNLSLSDLALKLDDNRIPSRIREVFKDIYMTGPGGKDWRKIKNPRGGAK